MKKILLVLFLLTALAASLALLSFAEEPNGPEKYLTEFHPSGKPEAPEPGYVFVIGNGKSDDCSAELGIYFHIPSDVIKANDYLHKCKGFEYNADFGIYSFNYFFQVDYSFDGGSWHATPEWDKTADFEEYDRNRLDNSIRISDRYLSGESFEGYCSAESLFAKGGDTTSFISTMKNGYDETVYKFDLENHSLKMRVRTVLLLVTYVEDGGYGTAYFYVSDWSEPFGIGKDFGTTLPEMPSKAETPVISDAEIHLNEGEDPIASISYYANIPVSYCDDVFYCEMKEIGEGVGLETQLSIDGGEWIDFSPYTIDDWIRNGWREVNDIDHRIKPDSSVKMRVRVHSTQLGYSDWTEVIDLGTIGFCKHERFSDWTPDSEEPTYRCIRTCLDCGYVDVSSHEFQTETVLEPATCYAPGTLEKTCSKCGVKLTEEIESYSAHDFSAWTTVDAEKCMRSCSICKLEEVENHNFTVESEVPATCKEGGMIRYACTECGFKTSEETPKLTAHRFEVSDIETSWWHENTDGKHERVCPDCGIVETGEHDWDEGVVTKKSTCAEEGVRTFTCKACHTVREEPISKSEIHDFDEEIWKTGETGHWHECKLCGEKIAFAEHTMNEPESSKEPTLCTVCRYVIKEAKAGDDGDGDDEDSDKKDQEKKCWLCGFCPCPLHICIFIWILIFIVLIVIVLIIIRKLTKKKEKKKEDQKQEDDKPEEKK